MRIKRAGYKKDSGQAGMTDLKILNKFPDF
jgi:hypothetical protein